jgi:hypothetical protein
MHTEITQWVFIRFNYIRRKFTRLQKYSMFFQNFDGQGLFYFFPPLRKQSSFPSVGRFKVTVNLSETEKLI